MQMVQSQDSSQQDTSNQNRVDGRLYCAVERTSGMHRANTSWGGVQWYSLSESGELKRFSHYENACGQKLYRDGKPWGEWKAVSQDKILYMYSGEQGLGIYDAEGRCLKSLDRLPNQKGILTQDVYDSKGNRVYHAASQTFYGESLTDAIVQIGAPSGTRNLDNAPVSPQARAYDDDPSIGNEYNPAPVPYDEDYQASPSDRYVAPAIETQYHQTTATVIDGEYFNQCGQRMYRLSQNQKVWELNGAEQQTEGTPAIQLTEAEIAAGRRDGEYTIVENEHGIFRIKDGEVERKAVVDRENWRTGHCECRCVPVRGCFGRIRYRQQSVWVEQSHSAVRLGWVKDPAVGIESKNHYDGYGRYDGSGRFGNNGAAPGTGSGIGPATGETSELGRGVDPFAPSSNPRVVDSDSPIRISNAVPDFNPTGVATPSTNPLPLRPGIGLPQEGSSDIDLGLPSLDGSSGALPRTDADIRIREPEKTPNNDTSSTPRAIQLDEVKTEGIEESQNSVPPLTPVTPPEQQDDSPQAAAPKLDTLPLEEEKPSVTDSPDGSPDTIPVQPWTPPKEVEREKRDEIEKEENERELDSPLELDSIVLPQVPKRQTPAQMAATLNLVGILQQIEHYSDMASRAHAVGPGGVDATTGMTQSALVAYVANAGFNPNAYDRLHASVNQRLVDTPKGALEHEWLTTISKSLSDKLGDVMSSDQPGPNGQLDTGKLYGALTENHRVVLGILDDAIGSGKIDLDAILKWAEESPDADDIQQIYGRQLEKLRDYRMKGGWQRDFKSPEENQEALPGRPRRGGPFT